MAPPADAAAPAPATPSGDAPRQRAKRPASGPGTQAPGGAAAAALYQNSTFMILGFKVLWCSRRHTHDWTECPFAHPGERARRRNPAVYPYASEMCKLMRLTGECELGDRCGSAHNVFEFWLHPERYRTQHCKDGRLCDRKVCFFGHSKSDLRRPSDPADPALMPRLDGLPCLAPGDPPPTLPAAKRAAAKQAAAGAAGLQQPPQPQVLQRTAPQPQPQPRPQPQNEKHPQPRAREDPRLQQPKARQQLQPGEPQALSNPLLSDDPLLAKLAHIAWLELAAAKGAAAAPTAAASGGDSDSDALSCAWERSVLQQPGLLQTGLDAMQQRYKQQGWLLQQVVAAAATEQQQQQLHLQQLLLQLQLQLQNPQAPCAGGLASLDAVPPSTGAPQLLRQLPHQQTLFIMDPGALIADQIIEGGQITCLPPPHARLEGWPSGCDLLSLAAPPASGFVGGAALPAAPGTSPVGVVASSSSLSSLRQPHQEASPALAPPAACQPTATGVAAEATRAGAWPYLAAQALLPPPPALAPPIAAHKPVFL